MINHESLIVAVNRERLRSRISIGIFFINIIWDSIKLLCFIGQAILINRTASGFMVSHAEIAANDARINLVNELQPLVFVVTVICFLMWFYTAYRNLSLVGTYKSRLSAGAATVYWFVPFLNLVSPYQSVVELWHRSRDNNSTEDVSKFSVPKLIVLWWLIFILSNIVGRIAMGISPNNLNAMTCWFIGSSIISIFAAVLAIRVVAGIHRYQAAFGILVVLDYPT